MSSEAEVILAFAQLSFPVFLAIPPLVAYLTHTDLRFLGLILYGPILQLWVIVLFILYGSPQDTLPAQMMRLSIFVFALMLTAAYIPLGRGVVNMAIDRRTR